MRFATAFMALILSLCAFPVRAAGESFVSAEAAPAETIQSDTGPVAFASAELASDKAIASEAAPMDDSLPASAVIVPASLTIVSAGLRLAVHEPLDGGVRSMVSALPLPRYVDVDSYVQYLPSAMHLGLGVVGVKSRNSFTDRLVESVIAHALCFAVSRSLKYICAAPRPDGGSLSFPSGHACLAFTGAELMRYEYGTGWGAAAYVCSSYVGAARLWGDRHWFTDVLAGAGIGMLCARAGVWLREPVKRWLGIREKRSSSGVEVAFAPVIDPLSGCFCPGVQLQF